MVRSGFLIRLLFRVVVIRGLVALELVLGGALKI
jgi:hypothetical protein